jgi:hypothetical protein
LAIDAIKGRGLAKNETGERVKRLWTIVENAIQHFLKYIGYKVRSLRLLLEELIWGYGERPFRIFGTAITIILGYSYLYYLALRSIPSHGVNSWSDCLYYATVTFTTLGLNDVMPTTLTLKFLVGSEALLGAFTIGLFVAGFANKSKC